MHVFVSACEHLLCVLCLKKRGGGGVDRGQTAVAAPSARPAQTQTQRDDVGVKGERRIRPPPPRGFPFSHTALTQ